MGRLAGEWATEVPLAVRGHDSQTTAVFENVANWTQSLGRLTLWLAGVSVPYQEYVLSFDVTNGMDGQDSPAVSIEATPQPLIAPIAMVKGPKNARPLLIGKHVFPPSIGQSTSSGSDWKLGKADRVNTLTVTLSTNMWLTTKHDAASPNCTLTMRGLLPSIEGTGTLTEYVTHGRRNAVKTACRAAECCCYSVQSGEARAGGYGGTRVSPVPW
jgi:hypothetical protein